MKAAVIYRPRGLACADCAE